VLSGKLAKIEMIYLPKSMVIIRDSGEPIGPRYISIKIDKSAMITALDILFRVMTNLKGLLIGEITGDIEDLFRPGSATPGVRARVEEGAELEEMIGEFALSTFLFYMARYNTYYSLERANFDPVKNQEKRTKIIATLTDRGVSEDKKPLPRGHLERATFAENMRSPNVLHNLEELIKLGIIDRAMTVVYHGYDQSWLDTYLSTGLDVDETRKRVITEQTEQIKEEHHLNDLTFTLKEKQKSLRGINLDDFAPRGVFGFGKEGCRNIIQKECDPHPLCNWDTSKERCRKDKAAIAKWESDRIPDKLRDLSPYDETQRNALKHLIHQITGEDPDPVELDMGED
jgi:hypothetical protein